MPSLINTDLAQNYRKTSPSTRFGTPQLVHALITISNINASDVDTVDGNFHNLISIVQKFGEIYAIGDPQFGEGGTSVTVILKDSTVTDSSYHRSDENYFPASDNASTLQDDLNSYFGQSVNVDYTTMYGLAYD